MVPVETDGPGTLRPTGQDTTLDRLWGRGAGPMNDRPLGFYVVLIALSKLKQLTQKEPKPKFSHKNLDFWLFPKVTRLHDTELHFCQQQAAEAESCPKAGEDRPPLPPPHPAWFTPSWGWLALGDI